MSKYRSDPVWSPNSGDHYQQLQQQEQRQQRHHSQLPYPAQSYPYQQYHQPESQHPQQGIQVHRRADLDIPRRNPQRPVSQKSATGTFQASLTPDAQSQSHPRFPLQQQTYSHPDPSDEFYQQYQSCGTAQARSMKQGRSSGISPISNRLPPSQTPPGSPENTKHSLPRVMRSASKEHVKKSAVFDEQPSEKKSDNPSPKQRRVEDNIFEKERPLKPANNFTLMKPFRVVSGNDDSKKKNKNNADPKSRYFHRNDSEDNIELMPTLAKGYENSVPLQNELSSKGSSSELLRITEDGYYFRERTSTPEPAVPPTSKYHIHQSYLQPTEQDLPFEYYSYDDKNGLTYNSFEEVVDSKRTEPSRDELGSVYNSEGGRVPTSPLTSMSTEDVDPVEEAEPRSKSPSKPVPPFVEKPVRESTQEKLNTESQRKSKGLFKKVFVNDTKRRPSPSHAKERATSENRKLERSKMKVDKRNISSPVLQKVSPITIYNTQEDIINGNNTSSVNFTSRTPVAAQQEPFFGQSSERIAVTNEQQSGLLNSIPIISTLFQKIDESEASDSTKLLLKVFIIFFILYELQTIMDIFTIRNYD